MEINVEQIMQEIREKIAAEENWEDLPPFESVPIRTQTGDKAATVSVPTDPNEYAQEVDSMNRTWNIVYFWPLSSNPIERFFQRVIKRILKFLFLPVIGQQNEFNAHTVRSMNWTKGNIDGLNNKASALEQRTDSLEQRIEPIEQRTDSLEQRIEPIEQRTDSLEQKIEPIEQRITPLEKRTDSLEQISAALHEHENLIEQKLQVLQQKVNELEMQNDDLLAALAKMFTAQETKTIMPVEKRKTVDCTSEEPTTSDNDNAYTVLDYFRFENRFRGARSIIRERQSIYLPYFKDQSGPILDLGCGRGEFLQVMKENHIPAFGIDLYPEYVIEGELLGLDIRQGDGIAYLQNTEEQFGGIYIGQVIEHLSFQQIQTLCAAAYEKLLPGAYIILETPNPMCLSVFANAFYIDPTHNKPVHPQTVKYLLDELRFQNIEVLFTKCSKLEPLPMIQSEAITNLDAVNAGISRVSELLYGSQDYAIVAKKPKLLSK